MVSYEDECHEDGDVVVLHWSSGIAPCEVVDFLSTGLIAS